MTALIREQTIAAMDRVVLADRLIVTPLLDRDRQIGPGSIDLRLGTEFLEADRQNQTIIAPLHGLRGIGAPAHSRTYVPLGGIFVLHPGQFVLGCTLEYLSVPADLIGQVLSRSSWGRLGLLVATAVIVQPGFRGVLTLELVNTGTIPIELRTGLRVAQLQLWQASETTMSPYSAGGQYTVPLGPESPKFDRELSELARLSAIASEFHGRAGGPPPVPPA